MKKLNDIVLVGASVVLVGAVLDLLGLTQYLPKSLSFGVTPGGYLKLAAVLILFNIALSLREKK